MPVKSPLNLAGDDSVTVVRVIGDCAPAVVKPKVRAMRTATVFGAKARYATNNGVRRVETRRDFFLPMRSLMTPICEQRKPETKKVMAEYSPKSWGVHPKNLDNDP